MVQMTPDVRLTQCGGDLPSQLYARTELSDITILGEADKPGPQRLLHSTWQEAYCGLRPLLFDMRRGSLAGWVARARGCKMSEDIHAKTGILVRGLGQSYSAL